MTIMLIVNEVLPLFNIRSSILTRTFLFTGIPFFFLGHFIAEYKSYIVSENKRMLWCAVLLIGIAEVLLSRKIGIVTGVYTGTLFMAAALFVLAVMCEKNKYNKYITIISQCSLHIYLWHIMIKSIIGDVFILTGKGVSANILPIMVCAITTIVSITINTINKSMFKRK